MKLNEQWINSTGLLLVTVLLVLVYNGESKLLLTSIAILCALIFVPKLLYPVGYVWFHFAKIISLLAPKIIFSLVFFFIVVPIGLFRRFFVKDSHSIIAWKESNTTLKIRDHIFDKKDLESVF